MACREREEIELLMDFWGGWWVWPKTRRPQISRGARFISSGKVRTPKLCTTELTKHCFAADLCVIWKVSDGLVTVVWQTHTHTHRG